jgi:hypothetical protein
MAGGWKLKIYISFYGSNSWAIALRQIKLGAVKDHGHTTSFIWIIIFFDKALNMAMLRNFDVMLLQTLNYSV